MVATGLAYDAGVRAAQAQVLARLVPRVRDIRRFGSAALDLAWTAAGRYDAYFERSVKPWDIAAGALICERAGLRVLELPAREGLPWGILAARPGLAEPLLRARRRRRSATRRRRSAAGGSRTHTSFRTRPFEGLASTVPPPPRVVQRGYPRGQAGFGAASVPRRCRPARRAARAPRSSPG